MKKCHISKYEKEYISLPLFLEGESQKWHQKFKSPALSKQIGPKLSKMTSI